MKTRLFTTLLLMFCFGVSIMWADDNKDAPILPIEIIKKDFTPNQPRHLAIIPIECYYYEGMLHFFFYEDLGDVEITITSENKNWRNMQKSSDGMGEICIAGGGVGNYSVEIITEYGECFVGDFEL